MHGNYEFKTWKLMYRRSIRNINRFTKGRLAKIGTLCTQSILISSRRRQGLMAIRSSCKHSTVIRGSDTNGQVLGCKVRELANTPFI
jgi:hypothetical protein